MNSSEQYWNQLLQQFQCENEYQLAALGIPIQNNALYQSACSAANAETKAHYEAIAALTLLHTHFRFIEYALDNDVFFMSAWAKHYSSNCVSGDEFVPIHEKILEAGGLDRLPQDNIRLSGMLLSVYGKLGLSMELAPMSRVKAAYIDSMNVILDCIVSNKTPSIPDRRQVNTGKPRERKRTANTSGKNTPSFLNRLYQSYIFGIRKNLTLHKDNSYCGYLFHGSEASQPVSDGSFEPLAELFATAAQQYSLPGGMDGFGDTAAQRYAYLAGKLRPSARALTERVFFLLENTYAADQTNEEYQNARYDYLQAGFEAILKSIPLKYDSQLAEMTKACTTLNLWDMEEPYRSIVSGIHSSLAREAERKQAFERLQKSPDPKILAMWTAYQHATEKEYGQIRAKADAIKLDFEQKLRKWERKRKFKRVILPILIGLALVIIALVIVGVLL